MNTTKPSAGALRAARTFNSIPRGWNKSNPVEELAEIIDRESGLAEALDALRGMVGLVQLINAREPDLQSNHRFIEAMRVIAKAGNPNSTATQPYPKGRYDTV